MKRETGQLRGQKLEIEVSNKLYKTNSFKKKLYKFTCKQLLKLFYVFIYNKRFKNLKSLADKQLNNFLIKSRAFLYKIRQGLQ
jgi:hypothetical protein